MAKAILVQSGIKEEDLVTCTTDQRYRLGQEFVVVDSDVPNAQKVFKYAYVTNSAVVYQPLNVRVTGTTGQEWSAVTIAATTGAKSLCGIPQVAVTSGQYAFFQVEGQTTVLINGTGTNAGNVLQMVATTGLNSTASAAITGTTVGIALATTTGTASTQKAILLGSLVNISS